MLTEPEKDRIAESVRRAEARLSAEILPAVFETSASYPEASWAGAAAAMLLACAGVLLYDRVHPLWSPAAELAALLPAAGLLGAALGRWWAPATRLLAGAGRMERAVERRAKALFYDHEVAHTAARSGVLIFASLLEHRVVILCDQAVRSRTKPEAWEPAIAALTAAAREGRVADGVCAAVDEAGKVLAAAGFSASGPDANELGDRPVTGR